MNWWALKINFGAVIDVILIAFHRDMDALIPTKPFFRYSIYMRDSVN